MKINRILGFVLAIGSLQNAFTQLVIPHPIPCLKINPTSIDTLGSGVSAADCIEVDGETVNFKTDQHYSIRAGEYIQFDPNTVITSDGSHQFHAYIQREDMDMAWYYPNATPGTVGQYEKLEIGVQFNDTIQEKIENFVTNQAGAKLNPFNPEDVDLYAEFWVYKDLPLGAGMAWFGPKRVNGFYYEEFARNADTIHWDTLATDHQFRIRFAPPATGLYRCKVSANVYGHGVQTVSEFTFESVPSDNKGFMQVGENARYLKVGNEPFFPVGQNLTGPNRKDLSVEWDPEPAKAYLYSYFHEQMTELASNGANYFRYIVSPWQSEIEYEHLGNYSNRMTNAWEFDKILDTAKALDLKMHYNMAIHYTFEAPSGYGMFNWDWSAKGDSLNPSTGLNSECFRDDDKGYCYRNELGLVDPVDFLTDTTAMNYYKRRLRYMVARWGYSTEIGVMELMSEVNNFGNTFIMEKRVDVEATDSTAAIYGCHSNLPDPENKTRILYEDATSDIFGKLANWQIEMCRYIKEDLGHYDHPLAVDYTGTPIGDYLVPNFGLGDSTFVSEFVDIANFNHYALGVNKAEITYNYIHQYHTGTGVPYMIKPMMNPESGANANTYKCDHNSGFIHRVCLTPFTGLAGSAMTWDSHFNEQDSWQYLGPVADFMEGVPLDAGNWGAQTPLVMEDLSIEILYLRDIGWKEDSRMIGAVSNRTFNYWTAGDDTLGCNYEDNNPADDIYDYPSSYISSDLDSEMKLENLGANNDFRIEWYNALTGEYDTTITQSSNLWGNLILDFPGTLTGDSISPILYFKFYPADGAFLAPIISSEFESKDFQKYDLAKNLDPIEPTPWADSLSSTGIFISISPNPTNGLVNCVINGDFSDLKWILTSTNGETFAVGNITSPNFSIDLSVYSSGSYFLTIQDISGGTPIQTFKIIKQ